MPTPTVEPAPTPPPAPARRAARIRSSEIRDLLRVAETPGMLSLAGGLPAPESLPTARVRAAVDGALADVGPTGATALQYGPTEGLDELRTLVAPGTAGSPALGDPADVLVTTGSQQAIELVARALVDPGDAVVVEDPLYLGTRQVLGAHGARLAPVPVDADGLDVDRLADALARGLRPRMVVVVPNFSNPSGASLTDERRARLGQLTCRYGFVIVEDDPYHGLGFSGPPPTPVRHHTPDRTVTIGSASKMIAPGLRVGWLGAPRWLTPTLALVKQTLDLHTATLNQLVVADILGDSAFLAAHLADVRRRGEARASVLHSALGGVVAAPVPDGGMFCWGEVGIDTRVAFPRAIAAGVAYVPGDAFTVARCGSHALRLSFAALAPTDLAEAAHRLRTVFAAV